MKASDLLTILVKAAEYEGNLDFDVRFVHDSPDEPIFRGAVTVSPRLLSSETTILEFNPGSYFYTSRINEEGVRIGGRSLLLPLTPPVVSTSP